MTPAALTRFFSHKKARTVKPICLIVHSMAEHIRFGGETVPAFDWLESHEELSVHALVYPNGQVLRGADDEDVAYHAGLSELTLGGKVWRGLNGLSLGAEFLVAGDHDYPSFLKAIEHPATFTEAQYQAGAQLYADWCKRYSLSVERIVGHSEVTGDMVRGPGNGKRDPGKGFDLAGFREMVKALLGPPPTVDV